MSPALRTALVATLVGILFIGVYPQPLIVLAQKLFPTQITNPGSSQAQPATTVDVPR
jgi:K+-transporting ATPase c subunit